jgi:hypothetical protein
MSQKSVDSYLPDVPRYRYCPLEAGEPVETWLCEGCAYRPEPPLHICAVPKATRPRRRGFWDREEGPPG